MIQTDISSINYVGNGSTTIPYIVPFYFLTAQDLVVVVRDNNDVETVQTLGTHYVVSGAGNASGGEITFTWAVPSSSQVSIFRVIEATQLTSYEEADAFPAKSHERALDKLTMICQQLMRVSGIGAGDALDLGTSFRVTSASGGIAPVTKRGDTVLGFDVLGNTMLRDAGEMLNFLSALGSAWANAAERAAKQPAFLGQLGIQLDDYSLWVSHSTVAGDWHAWLADGIVYAVSGKPTGLVKPAGDIVGTTESQLLTNKSLAAPTITDPTGLDKNDVGLGNVDNTTDLNKPISIAQGYALADKQDLNKKGVANGYASLDGSIKVPLEQIPDALLGASQYKGTWNATTNTPAIPAAGVGNTGWYYVVSVAGTTSIDGTTSWAVGDQIISNGTIWQKIVNVSAVSSVNTKTGAVVLVPADIGLGNVDNTSDATKNAASATLTNKTINGANNTLIVRLDADVTNSLPVSRLNNGTGAAANTWWCGDNSWKQPPGTGDVNGPVVSADGELAAYNGTTGKVIKAGGKLAADVVTGPASTTSGNVPQFSGTTGKILSAGLAAPTGALVGTTESQSLENKTFTVAGLAYRPSGLIYCDTATTTNTAGAETNLSQFTVPAGMLSRNGDALRISFFVFAAATTAARTVRLRLNSNEIFISSVAAAGGAGAFWHYEAWVTRISATTQRIVGTLFYSYDSGTNTTNLSVSGTETLANPLIVAITGTSSSALVSHRQTTIEFLPAP